MTDRELQKLSRADLLEMLVDLSEELNYVKQQLEAAEEKLNSRQIMIDKAGYIAEAALQLIGAFDTAGGDEQSAEATRQFNERQEEICREIELECREKARRRLEEVERKCMQMEEEATLRLSERQEEIRREIEMECREEAKRRLEEVERKCMQMEADTIERCARMQAMAKAETQAAPKYGYSTRNVGYKIKDTKYSG